MSVLVPQIRIVAEYPSPSYLGDYEPFRELMNSKFGLANLMHVGDSTLAQLQKQCRKGFLYGHSVGYCSFDRPQAVFFDMDSTVVEEESIVELAKIAGVGEHVDRITEAAMAGELDFEQALRERVKLLAGISETDVQRTAQGLTLSQGMIEFADFCRKMGTPIYLVSGGFMSLAAVIQQQVGFAKIRANVLATKDGVLTGQLVGAVVDGLGKRKFVQEICRELGVTPSSVAAVGDGANDRLMLQEVGCAVGFRPKPTLYDDIHAHINTGGHRFLAPLLFGRDLTDTRA